MFIWITPCISACPSHRSIVWLQNTWHTGPLLWSMPFIYFLFCWCPDDDDWRSDSKGVDMGRGCVVVVIMLSEQYSFLWMFCRSKSTEIHPNSPFHLPSHLISSNLTLLHFLRNHPCAVPQDRDKTLVGPSAMKASVTLLFFSASGSGGSLSPPPTGSTQCVKSWQTHMCVCFYTFPLHALYMLWNGGKKAVLAYWDGDGLLTALPITVSLFTHMQMFEKCCESDEMRGWVGLPSRRHGSTRLVEDRSRVDLWPRGCCGTDGSCLFNLICGCNFSPVFCMDFQAETTFIGFLWGATLIK